MAANKERIAEIEAALVRELIHVTGQQDVASAVGARTSAQMGELADLLKRPGLAPDEELTARLILGWLYWVRSLGELGDERARAVEMLVPAFVAGLDIEQFPPALLPALADAAMTVATTLLGRASESRGLSELSGAVDLWRRIVSVMPVDHPLRATQMSNLGLALRLRYQRTGAIADLEDALGVTREARAGVREDHPDRAGILSNLASLLQARFEVSGSLSDLEEAVQVAREAVAIVSESGAGILSNLGTMLQAHAAVTGSLTDLEDAVAVARKAVARTDIGDPDRARRLSILGNALQSLYQGTGEFDALNEAIEIRRLAVAVTPPDHPDRAGRLSNLGNALQDRFARTGSAEELDQALSAVRAALEATPEGHPDRAAMLSNLGNALQARFAQTGDPSDLDEALSAVRAALEATPEGHPDRAAMLSNLGNALQARFAQTGDPSDLDEATRAAETVVGITPELHPDRAKRLSALGRALQLRYERTGARMDFDRALQAFAESSRHAAPVDRIWAARLGGELAASTNPLLAADLMSTAVLSLPELAPSWLERGDQRFLLEEFSGLAADAAALALANGRVDSALELLEVGRGIYYGQILDLRSDLSDLRGSHPDLADRISRLRKLLDNPAHDGDAAADPRRSTHERRRLAEDWQSLLAEVRALPGFFRFALPPSAEELAQAAHGTIVVLNVSRYGSHALLLTESGLRSLPLPGLSPDVVLSQVGSFREALFTATDGESPTLRQGAQDLITKTLEWLWDVAVDPILDALGYQDQPAPGADWPHVWWSPEGPLALLPLHAAGHHSEPGNRRTVIDRVVSSYTPTVRALGDARRALVRPLQEEPRALAVAMPTTPGIPGALPSVIKEVQILQQYLRDVVALIEPSVPELAEQIPTREVVLRYLPDCPIVHFACHGFSDPDDPSQSRLLLHDHVSAPLTVAALSALHLDNARLAYLSASQTAVSVGSHLLGEAVNLTTAFHLAGYPHVIGTLWNIDDHAGAQIAADFYRWLADGSLDVNRAAEALHHAVRAARDAFRGTPSAWAAHIHSGA